VISCDRSRRDLLRLATAGRQLCLLGSPRDQVDLDTLSAELAVVDQTLQPNIQEAVGTAAQPVEDRDLPNESVTPLHAKYGTVGLSRPIQPLSCGPDYPLVTVIGPE
jgi:hypothetical protein